MPDIAYVNGKWSLLKEAQISILDRGLLFGDSVYEVLRASGFNIIGLEEHLERLHRSLQEIFIKGIKTEEIKSLLYEALERAGYSESFLYLQITRGIAAYRSHLWDPYLKPSILLIVTEHQPHPPEFYERGVKIITVPETRWQRRDIKSTNLLPNVLAKHQADKKGAYEALFVEPDGRINEGASTNIFLLQQGTLLTPPVDHCLLPGVTRQILIKKILPSMKIPVEERDCLLEDLYTAAEAFLAGTTTEIVGIVEVDGRPIGTGCVGPLTRKIHQAYRDQVSSKK